MCIFCKIVNGEIAATKVYEDEKTVVFEDVNPVAPTHLLVIPKAHIASLNEVAAEHAELLGHLQVVSAKMAKEKGLAADGYRLVMNCGEMGGQTVDHLHYHLIGGKLLGWPPFTDIKK